MAGYTRQSEASIQPGEDITAAPLNAEFDAVESAFSGTTGHTHDGTTGNGPKIPFASLLDTIDEDDMATNSATKIPTQQSVKAYVDASAGFSITGQTAKTSLVDADQIPLADSAASNVNKKITWANVITTLTTSLASVFFPSTRTIRTISSPSTTDTLVLSDKGKVITVDSNNPPGDVTVTIPPNSSVAFPIGTQIDFVLNSTSASFTWTAGTGVYVYCDGGEIPPGPSGYFLYETGKAATLMKVGTNEWCLFGGIGVP